MRERGEVGLSRSPAGDPRYRILTEYGVTEVWPESPDRVPNSNRDASIKRQNRSKLAQEIDLEQCYLLVVILITILLVE